MAVPASLFIQPFIQRTQSVNFPQTEVLSVQTNFSTVDSILVTNLTNVDIFVFVRISTGNFLIVPKTKVLANSILQLLNESYFNLNTGETLLASSDSSQNSFNITIEGRLFKELV